MPLDRSAGPHLINLLLHGTAACCTLLRSGHYHTLFTAAAPLPPPLRCGHTGHYQTWTFHSTAAFPLYLASSPSFSLVGCGHGMILNTPTTISCLSFEKEELTQLMAVLHILGSLSLVHVCDNILFLSGAGYADPQHRLLRAFSYARFITVRRPRHTAHYTARLVFLFVQFISGGAPSVAVTTAAPCATGRHIT